MQTLTSEDPCIPYSRLHEALDEVSETRLQVSLKLLRDGGLVEQDDNLEYHIVRMEVKSTELAQLVQVYRDKSARDHEALERMVFYAQTGFCRWKVLLEYFDEKAEWEHCGSCDNCREPPEQALTPEHIRDHAPPSVKEEKLPPPDAGTPVRVPKYGEGKVVCAAGDKVTIVFPDSQKKTFLRDFVTPL